jgi:flagellin
VAQTTFNGINPFLAIAGGVSLQTGANNGETTALTAVGTLFNTTTLNLVGTINFTTSALSGTSIAAIDAGLVILNAKRATLGATQNRLEFTINILAIKEENSLASESAIRDANIATETINFTRNQILVTAGTSLLAQANLIPQTALQLLD